MILGLNINDWTILKIFRISFSSWTNSLWIFIKYPILFIFHISRAHAHIYYIHYYCTFSTIFYSQLSYIWEINISFHSKLPNFQIAHFTSSIAAPHVTAVYYYIYVHFRRDNITCCSPKRDGCHNFRIIARSLGRFVVD